MEASGLRPVRMNQIFHSITAPLEVFGSLRLLPVCGPAWEETSHLRSSVDCRYKAVGFVSASLNCMQSGGREDDKLRRGGKQESNLSPQHHKYTVFTVAHGFAGMPSQLRASVR